MAQLAIRGHATRGKEVIEILEMLGGENEYKLNGCNIECAYYKKNGVIYNTSPVFLNNIKLLTLENFLEKFPYKVGDKVHNIIHNENQTITDLVWEEGEVLYQTNNNEYVYVNYLQPYKEETMEEKENSVVVNIEHKQLKVNSLMFDKTQLVINDKYELKQERDAYYIVRKQPQYPKTYKECCEVLSLNSERATWGIEGLEYKRRFIVCFQRLLICRDAYWKIAGEQMGLGKPWEHDILKDEFSSAISYQYGYIQKCEIRHTKEILIFPTVEMRDAFYENFKELIELVKELL